MRHGSSRAFRSGRSCLIALRSANTPRRGNAPRSAISRRRLIGVLCGWTLSLVIGFSFSSFAEAGKYNRVLSIGDAAPEWKDLPGVDGRRLSLSDLADKELVVLVFTCNSCPYAVDYEDRLVAFHEKYGEHPQRVALVAVNVNQIEEDRLPAMIERAEAKGFRFPYLYDESQRIAKDYGAIRTPEFIVLDKDRKVAYMGAMDDSSDIRKVKLRYLEEAVDALLNGKKPGLVETPPIGCAIRFVRERR
jgi:thiol-disulfide isomerase/thioredoxin